MCHSIITRIVDTVQGNSFLDKSVSGETGETLTVTEGLWRWSRYKVYLKVLHEISSCICWQLFFFISYRPDASIGWRFSRFMSWLIDLKQESWNTKPARPMMLMLFDWCLILIVFLNSFKTGIMEYETYETYETDHPVARAGQMLGEEPLAPSWI